MSDGFELAQRAVRQAATKTYGKYRGIVTGTDDPNRKGVLRVRVPSVLGDTEVDAEPCFPYGGADGIAFAAIPPVGAGVFVEFVEGDISAPVWVGVWTREALPSEAGTPPDVKLWKTAAGHRILLDDTSGQETLTIVSGKDAKITLTSQGSIELEDSAGNKATLDAAAQSVTLADAAGNEVALSSTGVEVKDVAGNSVTLAASGVTVKGTQVKVDAAMVSLGQGAAEALIKGTTFLASFNSHTHNCTAPGSPSGPPIPPLTPAVLTMATTAA